MKTAEIPQDRNTAIAGERKAIYAMDDAGRYTAAPSTGWTVEEIVTGQAVEEYARLAADALQRARAGLTSPLEFHMYDRRLELPTLAQCAGLWRWRVRRHLKPAVFARLSSELLRRYADAMGITVDQLTRLPP